MKKVILIALLFAACKGKPTENKGISYNPKQRNVTMLDSAEGHRFFIDSSAERMYNNKAARFGDISIRLDESKSYALQWVEVVNVDTSLTVVDSLNKAFHSVNAAMDKNNDAFIGLCSLEVINGKANYQLIQENLPKKKALIKQNMRLRAIMDEILLERDSVLKLQ